MPGLGGSPVTVALSGTLHIIFSALLGYRVVCVSRKTFGKRPTVWSVIVEAAVPYAVVSVIFMAVYCADIAAANVFGAMLVQFQVRLSGTLPRSTSGYAWLTRGFGDVGHNCGLDHHPHDEGRAYGAHACLALFASRPASVTHRGVGIVLECGPGVRSCSLEGGQTQAREEMEHGVGVLVAQ